MEEDRDAQMDTGRKRRLVQRLDQMVARGRVTNEEADRLRSAGDDEAFEEAVGAIRARHVVATLAKRVADGCLSQAEADDLLERVRRGEHSRALVEAVHGDRPATGHPRPTPAGAEHTGQEGASA